MTQPHQLGYGFAGSSKYGNYYRHSGQINFGGVAGAAVIGLVAAFAMGWIYTLSVIYIPIDKLNAIACACFGLAMGAIPAAVLTKMKVRNVQVSLAIVAVITVFGLYTSWVSWEWWLMRSSGTVPFVDLFLRPQAVIRVAEVINGEGTWRFSEHDTENTKGTFLTVIWIAEALTILITAPMVAKGMISGKPFCEKCDQWCAGPTTLRRTALTDKSALRQKLEAGDFAFVSTLPAAGGGQYLEFQRHTCDKCGQLNSLSVVSRSIKTDRKGRVRGNTKKTIVNKLLVLPEDLQKITTPAAAQAK